MSSFSPAIETLLAAPPDQRRLGPYLCKELLDQAGSAPVFHAVEEHGGRVLRDVAVKVFDLGQAEDSERVVDEARSLCRVQHPNVVRFHTLSTDPKKGLLGLVMELAIGTSLDRELAELPQDDPRRVQLAVDAGIGIASALAAAHEAGIAHCNVKPSNIMLTEGAHKLLNFGISASVRKTVVPGERSGLRWEGLSPAAVGKKASSLGAADDESIIGTIGYIDPFCLKTTNPPSTSSDLYSLGATLYQCLTGDVPAVATAKKNGTAAGIDPDVLLGRAAATPVTELVPGVPPDLAKLVDALVAPTREGRPRTADVVRHSLERIRSALAGQARELPPESRGPFPGLARYEAADRDVFFGRAAETAGVIELLRTRGLVCILGLSGTGKSSFARAALVPAVEEGALGGWPTKYRSAIVTPGKNLWAALDEALAQILGAKLADHPEAALQQLAANVDAKGEGIVLLVDQLEEIVAHDGEESAKGRERALDLLSRLAEGPAGIRVIATARRDLLDDFVAIDPHFARALSRGTQLLSPVSRTGWGEVLDRSLEAYGFALEDDALRSAILADLDRLEAAMPLAQFGLAQLWAKRDSKRKVIGREGFDPKRGLRAALEKHADATVAGLKEESVREVVLALTTPEGTRAHVPRKELAATDVVSALEKGRLVVEDKDGVAFVHDAVLREWELARRWIESSRDDRLIVAHAERDAKRWTETRDPAELWRKGRLAAGLEIWKHGTMPLSDDARRFLAASAQDEHKAARFKWLVGIGFLALVLGGLLFYVKITKDSEERARRDAEALAAALAEVRTLKQAAEESALESQATAKLLHELQEKSKADQAAFGANVKAALSKVTSATSLDGAQKAAEGIKVPATSTPVLVPIPSDLGGPKLDPGGPSPSAGGGGFDQAAIERVVAARKAGVKRTCLERSASNAASTKVSAKITIAPNGTVQNVSSTGDDPAVAKCIEQQLRTWTFPAPGETKEVQIPFVFVRQ